MLKRLALELSKDGTRSYEVNLYLLKNNLIMLSTLLLILLLGYILGVFKWTIINVFTVMIFRGFSGGSHSKSKIICTILSTIVPITFALLIKNKLQFISSNVALTISIIVFLIGIILVHKYAPADTPQKPIISIDFKKQLKKNSFIFLILIQLFIMYIYLLGSTHFSAITFSFVLGLSWQLMTITPQGYRLMYLVDTIF